VSSSPPPLIQQTMVAITLNTRHKTIPENQQSNTKPPSKNISGKKANKKKLETYLTN